MTTEDLENPTTVEAPEPVQNPYNIFVSYVVGKDKFNSTILNTAFEEVDSIDKVSGVINHLTQQHDGKKITLINFQSLES